MPFTAAKLCAVTGLLLVASVAQGQPPVKIAPVRSAGQIPRQETAWSSKSPTSAPALQRDLGGSIGASGVHTTGHIKPHDPTSSGLAEPIFAANYEKKAEKNDPAARVGAAGEMIGFSHPDASGSQTITLVHTGKSWIAVYHIDRSGQIRLVSSRPIDADFSLQLNATSPLPEEIREMAGKR